MRPIRTLAESKIVERLPSVFTAHGITAPMIDPDVTDAPDVIVHHSHGKLGIEICRLDYEAYCKWLATPPGSVYSRAAEVSINLRKLLASVVRKKRNKYGAYVGKHSLSECWLVLHNNLFEFPEVGEEGRADRRWFEEHSSWELQDQQCPFDRVLFNLEHPDRWYSLFHKGAVGHRKAVITRWPSIIFREAAIVPTLGVNTIDLSDQPNKPTFE